jgi:hypothetical protein
MNTRLLEGDTPHRQTLVLALVTADHNGKKLETIKVINRKLSVATEIGSTFFYLLLLVPPSILFWSWVSPLTTKLRYTFFYF